MRFTYKHILLLLSFFFFLKIHINIICNYGLIWFQNFVDLSSNFVANIKSGELKRDFERQRHIWQRYSSFSTVEFVYFLNNQMSKFVFWSCLTFFMTFQEFVKAENGWLMDYWMQNDTVIAFSNVFFGFLYIFANLEQLNLFSWN